ncbi:hypothetical protein ABT158_48735 [Nonomuraea sp. NPDC001636]|uniref:hypothetical protein n=1 Tax=Nonomuraea sp. NPDC001636 TaxID=3154391 RepID=UPI0033168F85
MATSTRGETLPYAQQGAFLKAKRTARLDGLKVAEVARLFAEMTRRKFSRNNIDHWESGRREADDHQVVVLALIYRNIEPNELEHDMGRPGAARLLERVREHGAPELGIPAPHAVPATHPALDLDQLTDRQRRQIQQIRAMRDTTPAEQDRMIASLLKHYESTADLVDVQLGIDTA